VAEPPVKFPSTPHLEWLGTARVRGDKLLSTARRRTLLSRTVTIEEKVDGANVGIVQAESDVALFSKVGCPHCARAKRQLADAGIPFEEILLGPGVTGKSLRAITGAETVPQVFVGGQRIGSADELEKWLADR
jgi:glutaredoxin-like protein